MPYPSEHSGSLAFESQRHSSAAISLLKDFPSTKASKKRGGDYKPPTSRSFFFTFYRKPTPWSRWVEAKRMREASWCPAKLAQREEENCTERLRDGKCC